MITAGEFYIVFKCGCELEVTVSFNDKEDLLKDTIDHVYLDTCADHLWLNISDEKQAVREALLMLDISEEEAIEKDRIYIPDYSLVDFLEKSNIKYEIENDECELE